MFHRAKLEKNAVSNSFVPILKYQLELELDTQADGIIRFEASEIFLISLIQFLNPITTQKYIIK